MITEEMLKEFDAFRSENMSLERTEFHQDFAELSENGMVTGIISGAIHKIRQGSDPSAVLKLMVALCLLTGYHVGVRMGKKEAACLKSGTTLDE